MPLGEQNRPGTLVEAFRTSATAPTKVRADVDLFLRTAQVPISAATPAPVQAHDGKLFVLATASRDGRAYPTTGGVAESVRAILQLASRSVTPRGDVAIPLLGAGNGGLDAREVARTTIAEVRRASSTSDLAVTLFTNREDHLAVIVSELRAAGHEPGESNGADIPMSAETAAPSDLSLHLQLAVTRGGILGENSSKQPVVSFHSLFVALLFAPEPQLGWIRRAALSEKLDPARVFARWETAGYHSDRAARTRAFATTRPSSSLPNLTSSASALLDAARTFAHESGQPRADVEHLLAAILLSGSAHGADLDAWGIDRAAWLGHVTARVQRAQPEFLRALIEEHDRALPFALADTCEVTFGHARARAGSGPVTLDLLFAGILASRALSASVTGRWLAKQLRIDPPPTDVASHRSDTYSAWFGPAPTIPVSEPVREALERARVLAASNNHIRAWHVLAGALSGSSPELKWNKGWPDPATLLRALRALVSEQDPAEAAYWALLLDGDPSTTIAGYTNDIARGQLDDRLGFRRSAEALAAVLNSAQSTPPLSVGVFGNWGSGKSFFLSLTQNAVARTAEDETKRRASAPEGRTGPYCADVLQVEFNAWQYMDSNLWASLTTHIFDEINRQLGSDQKSMQKYVEQLASVRDELDDLEARKAPLADQILQIDKQLNDPKTLAKELQKQALGHAAQALEDQLGISEVERSIEAIQRQATALKSPIGKLVGWLRFVIKHPWTLLVFVIPTAVAFLVPTLQRWLSHDVSVVIALLTAVGTFLTDVYRRTQPVIAKAEAAIQEAKHSREQERAKLIDKLNALDLRRLELEGEIRALRDGVSFKKFVLERAQSTDYRSQLGAISMASADLQQLAKRLADSSDTPHVERIILYIDDLDRCPPSRVVEVLQAVHLLLALPLFVVVVAVDSRWLLRSLEAHYTTQFGKNAKTTWEATPQHYLEKIFQIVYAVPPMPKALVPEMLESMVELLPRIPSIPEPEPAPATPPPTPLPEKTDRFARRVPFATIAAIEPGQPPRLQLTTQELEHLQSLADLLATPRALKRLANVYRFARATLPPTEIDAFLRGPFQLAQTFLAMNIGDPRRSREFFQDVLAARSLDAQTMSKLLTKHTKTGDRWWESVSTAFARMDLADSPANAQTARFVAQFGFDSSIQAS